MREGWVKKHLGEVCEIYNGGTPSTNNPEYWDGGIQWITPKDMGKSKDMYVSRCERTITPEGVEHSSTKVLPVRSVIVSSRAPIGYVAINEVPMATNQGCKGFVLGKEIYPEFLYYFLLSSTDLLNKLGTGATFKEVSGKKLAGIELPFPSLPEQQRIVDILDREFAKIDTLKANAAKSLQAAKDLFQATLKKELEPKEGWKTQMIGQICILKSGNSNANNSPSGSLPFVKVGDMNIEGNEVFITCSSRYVDYESNKKGVFPVGSVIFPKRGGAILTNKKRLTATEICCDLNIMGVFPKYDILTPEYLFAFFQGVDMASIYDGAAIPQINNGDISPLRISFPNVQTQKCIVSRLEDLNDKCNTLQQNYQKTLTLCDDLKQSLLRKAFNGEL